MQARVSATAKEPLGGVAAQFSRINRLQGTRAAGCWQPNCGTTSFAITNGVSGVFSPYAAFSRSGKTPNSAMRFWAVHRPLFVLRGALVCQYPPSVELFSSNAEGRHHQ